MKTPDEIIDRLWKSANLDNVNGMARFGIATYNTLGVPMPALRAMATEIGRDHMRARTLWESGIHEARILAGLIDDPRQVSPAQMEAWVAAFDSWDVCDQVCSNLFDKTPHAREKAVEWAGRNEEFVKRAGFVLMAELAVHDKKATDERFVQFLPEIVLGAVDDRNFVKKAVNWALRQIGKRNLSMNTRAIETARTIQQIDTPSARWIAADALRELTSEKVQVWVRKPGRPPV